MADTHDLRLHIRVTFMSQGETVTGRNTGVTFVEAAGVATGTSAQAHNLNKGDRIFLSAATGGNAAIYNDGLGYIVLTTPTTTTFTIAVPPGTGNSAGTVVADKPINCVGHSLASIQTPSTLTATSFNIGVDVEGTLVYANLTDQAGAVVVFAAVTSSKVLVPTTSQQALAGFSNIRLIAATGGAAAGAQRIVLGFVRTNE